MLSLRPFRAVAVAMMAALAAGGCAKTIVQINSKPQAASIYINGERQGATPMQKALLPFGSDPQERVFIQLVKPGYKPVLQMLRRIEIPDDEKLFFTLEEI